jgi:hypothetical protein
MIHSPAIVCLNEKAANGVGTAVQVTNFGTVLIQIGSINNGACTVKFQGSLGQIAPNFNSGKTVANHWDYISAYDLNSSTGYIGSTGIVFAGTDVNNIRNIIINTDAIDWINVEVSGYSAGKITAKVFGFSL